MSNFYAIADAIQDRLKGSDLLKNVGILIDRQKDVKAEVDRLALSQSGNLIVIAWVGSKNNDKTADGPHFLSSFSVTVFAKPVLRTRLSAADDIVETCCTLLHDFRPDGSFHKRLIVTGVDPTSVGEELLAYRINLETPSQL
jgi:hypothetical protein